MVTVTPNNHIFTESKFYNSGSQQQVIELAICFSWEATKGRLRDHTAHLSYEESGRERSVLAS